MLIAMILKPLPRDLEGWATFLDPFRTPCLGMWQRAVVHPESLCLRNNPGLSQHPQGKREFGEVLSHRRRLGGPAKAQRFSRDPRDFRHGLDLRAPRLGSCNVFLRRFRSISLFWRVMSRVIAGTKRRGTTMTVWPRARNAASSSTTASSSACSS